MQAECVERLLKLAQHAFLRLSGGPTKEVVRVGLLVASDGSKRVSYTYDALAIQEISHASDTTSETAQTVLLLTFVLPLQLVCPG
jgi:hypothetical protein